MQNISLAVSPKEKRQGTPAKPMSELASNETTISIGLTTGRIGIGIKLHDVSLRSNKSLAPGRFDMSIKPNDVSIDTKTEKETRMHDYVEFFRYEDRTRDVFIENDRLVLASAEPFGWAYLHACRFADPAAERGFCFSEPFGADAAYLASLTPADDATARAVIKAANAEEQEDAL